MCYPCRNCGQCGSELKADQIKCPKCGTSVSMEEGACAQCGWMMPQPPGISRTKDALRQSRTGDSKQS